MCAVLPKGSKFNLHHISLLCLVVGLSNCIPLEIQNELRGSRLICICDARLDLEHNTMNDSVPQPHTHTHTHTRTHTHRGLPVCDIGVSLHSPGLLQLTLTDVQTHQVLEVWSQESGNLSGPTAQVHREP